jgi:hypothetical protein
VREPCFLPRRGCQQPFACDVPRGLEWWTKSPTEVATGRTGRPRSPRALGRGADDVPSAARARAGRGRRSLAAGTGTRSTGTRRTTDRLRVPELRLLAADHRAGGFRGRAGRGYSPLNRGGRRSRRAASPSCRSWL